MSSPDPGAAAPLQPRDIRVALPDTGRLPRVGKLRLGIRKQGSNSGRAVEYPSATDYFVVNEDASTSRTAADSFHEVYGDEPRELDVTLPAARVDDVLRGVWRAYGAGGLLKRRCDGAMCEERDAKGVKVYGPCACLRDGLDPEDKRNHCQLRWTLTIMLMRVKGVGVWQLDTGSPMSAGRLTEALRMIESFRGHLQGAKATLRVVPQQVSPGGVAKTVYIAELGSSDITPEEALQISSAPRRVELPESTLDEAPDDLLDYDAIEGGGVGDSNPASGLEPVAILSPDPAAADDGIAADVDPPSVSVQVKALSAHKRGELYRLAEIPRGSKSDIVRSLICAAWDDAGLPPFENEPDVAVLLAEMLAIEAATLSSPEGAEAFGIFAETGEEIAPGDQRSMYGTEAPS